MAKASSRRSIYLVFYGINHKSGGLTIAALNQARMFDDEGHSVNLTTFDYQSNYRLIFNELEGMGRTRPSIRHINKYEYYAEKNNKDGAIDTSYYDEQVKVEEAGFIVVTDRVSASAVHYFNQGMLAKTKYYSNDMSFLEAVEYFNDSRELVKRVDFTPKKCALRVQYFSVRTRQVSRESFFTTDGYCFMTRYHRKNGDPGQVFLFDRYGEGVIHFSGNVEHDKHWLNELAALSKMTYKQLPVFICHGQGSGLKVAGIKKELAKRIYFLHGSHLKAPYVYGSEVVDKYEDVLNSIKEFDGFIVMTEKQKVDIERQYGRHSNMYVIPNVVAVRAIESYAERGRNKVVMVARLAPGKDIPAMVSIFSKVVEEVPDAKLDIYGIGDEEESIKGLISKLGLDESVFLRGYTQDASKVMALSNISVMTTRHEGFGLVVAESLMMGTPIVTYDYSYGASDIVRDGKSGYVIKPGDKGTFANRVIYLLNSEKKARRMGANGRKSVIKKFSQESVMSRWRGLFEAVYK